MPSAPAMRIAGTDRARAIWRAPRARVRFPCPDPIPPPATVSRITSATRVLVARAPTRIDFGGGWTDVPPYPAEHGGFVCNLAIAHHATVRLAEGGRAGASDAEAHGMSALVTAALRRAGASGLRAALASDFPIGAGLGGSSAAGVAMQGALAAWRGARLDRTELAEASRAIEVHDLGVAGGRQDHYAAAYGGALGLRFLGRGDDEWVEVEQIALAPSTRAALEQRLVLVYTGQSRISGDTITAVLDAYAARVPRVLDALQRMKHLAEEMARALAAGDVDALGAHLREHWTHQRALHPAITTPTIDAIVDAAARAGALGWKALGASGGGCVVLVAPDHGADRVRAAVAPFGEMLDVAIDDAGVTVLHDEAEGAA